MRVNPILSLWRVVGAQALVGILVAVVAGFFFGQVSIGYSALYGAMAVCLPSAVFARGLTSRFSSANPSSAVMGFFVWEMAKVGLTVAMLFAAPPRSDRFKLACHVGGSCDHDEGLLGGVCMAQSVSPSQLS